jgi:putative transposase
VSYRDVEEIFAERNIKVDHSTLKPWVIKASAAKKNKRTVATSWRMVETYIQIKGQWVYLYHAVDKLGDAIATGFFKQAIDILTAATIAENKLGIMPKFKHKI